MEVEGTFKVEELKQVKTRHSILLENPQNYFKFISSMQHHENFKEFLEIIKEKN